MQQDVNLPQHIPDPSETAPLQNVSEPSDITTNNPQSITITNDSKILQIPKHHVTQNTLTKTLSILIPTKTALLLSQHQIPISFHNFKRNNLLLEITIHLLYRHKMLLNLCHILLHNEVPLRKHLLLKTHPRHSSIQRILSEHCFYQLYRMLQLNIIKYRIPNLFNY